MNNIIIAIIIILIILIIYFNYTKVDLFKSNKDPVIVYFSADWCHNCVAFQPVWDSFITQTPVKTSQIKDEDIHRQFNVTSYPSIRLYFSDPVPGSNDFKAYIGDRSQDDLNKFIKRNI